MIKKSSSDDEEEFEDDFDDEEEEKPKKPVKIKFEEKGEEEEEENVFEDDDKDYQEEKVETRGRPKGTFRTPQKVQTQNIQKKERIESEELYSVYHQTERHGVKNNKTGDSEGEQVLDLLCKIMNKIHNLEVNLIGAE